MILMEYPDTDDGITVFQTIVSLNDSRISNTLARHDAFHEHILRHTDVLIARNLHH